MEGLKLATRMQVFGLHPTPASMAHSLALHRASKANWRSVYSLLDGSLLIFSLWLSATSYVARVWFHGGFLLEEKSLAQNRNGGQEMELPGQREDKEMCSLWSHSVLQIESAPCDHTKQKADLEVRLFSKNNLMTGRSSYLFPLGIIFYYQERILYSAILCLPALLCSHFWAFNKS